MPDWPVQGTTGYDALGTFDRVFVDPSGEGPLTALAGEFDDREENGDWIELVHRRKRAVADGILRSEVLRVVRELGEGTDEQTADAVAELAAWFPVYRSYLPFGAEYLDEARRAATESRPDLAPVIARISDASRRPLRADDRRHHGEGRGGQRLLPFHPADVAHRGRRRPVRVRPVAGGVPPAAGGPRTADCRSR